MAPHYNPRVLYAAGIAAGVLAGFASRGSLRRLAANVGFPHVWLLYAALGGQILVGFARAAWLGDDVRFGILLGSYGGLVLWLAAAAAVHRRWMRVGFAIVALGTAANLAAMAPNGGIPVSRAALRAAGASAPSGLANRFAVKHVLAGDDTILNPLGDVIPLPPLRDVVGVGDLLVFLGAGLVVASGMRQTPAAAPISSTPQPEAAAAPPALPRPIRAVRGGVLDRDTTVLDFLSRFASAYSVGKASATMSDEPRHPSQSRVVLSQAMAITDANLAGNVHGGVVMKLVDTAAGLAAIKHAHGRVVTVAMDEMSFLEPVFLTDVVTLYAQVNDVGRTSMEVGVRVEAENTITGERRHVSSAYLVFVALDEDGRPRPVPHLEPGDDEERRRMEDAKIRRRHRIARKDALMARRRAEAGGEPQPAEAPGA